MMRLVAKNWSEFQHYKDRCPPWIRLHKGLLDNYEFQCLPVASRALAPMLWLLASENMAGEIDATPNRLAFRLRMTEKELSDALKPLIDKGFFILASGVLADCLRDAVPETETETETETEAEAEAPERRKRGASLAAPPNVDPQVWADWLTLRKAKRAPVTQTVVTDAIAEAAKAGMTLEAFLRQWCSRGSQGLKADWIKPVPAGRPPPGGFGGIAPASKQERDAGAMRMLGFTETAGVIDV